MQLRLRMSQGFALAILLATAAPALAGKPVASLRATPSGNADATRDVREWHDARHRSCRFERVLSRTPVPMEDGEEGHAEKWVVEACKGAQYAYRVTRIDFGSGTTIMVGDFAPEATARIPALADEPQVASNAPEDRPGTVDDAAEYEKAIAPHVAQGRATWPSTKARYLAGLPAHDILFVTIKLYEDDRWEQIFVRVDRIEGAQVHGRIANELRNLSEHRNGDPIEFAETEVMDWTIARPDGTEEGNFVGKFLDTYQSGQ